LSEDDCLPRDSLAEHIESLADAEHLADAHPPGSEAEEYYVKGVGDAAKAVRDFSTE
jgi:hypothetical protein